MDRTLLLRIFNAASLLPSNWWGLNLTHCYLNGLLCLCALQYDELEGVLRDSGVLAQTEKAEQLEVSLNLTKGVKNGSLNFTSTEDMLKLLDCCCYYLFPFTYVYCITVFTGSRCISL